MKGIKDDYAGWGNDINDLDEPQKSIRLRMIDEFNRTLDVKSGRKFDKITSNGSVWGFVTKDDGVHKGIPHKMGDVFKATLVGLLLLSGLEVLSLVIRSFTLGQVLTT